MAVAPGANTTSLVVIGSGVGGLTTAKLVAKQKNVDVTLIGPTEYCEWSPGHIRSLVAPSETSLSIAPSVVTCAKNVKCVQARATGVTADSVTLSTGASIKYDFLLLATGGRYAHPSTAFLKSCENAAYTTDRIAEVQAKAAELKAAETVLIVGAGAVGIELAAEIAQTFPDKQVTLASRGEIGQMFHPKVVRQCLKRFAKLPNVTLKPNTSVSPGAEGALAADVTYYATGFTPNTEFLKDGALASALADNGLVKVHRDTMLVEGQTGQGPVRLSNVFALGDITTPGLMEAPFNSGYVVQQESKKVAKNILNAIGGKPLKPMGKPPMTRGGLLTLGKGHGAGHFDNMVMPQFVVAMMKSKDLFRKKVVTGFSK